MTGKYFLDTNFLVYCFSSNEPEKKQKCLDILQRQNGKTLSFVISTQVVNEFTAVMLNKLKQPPAIVLSIIHTFKIFEIVNVDIAMIEKALAIHAMHHLSYWDSLILSAAIATNCKSILTEDLDSGAMIAGITIQSPFDLP